MHIMHIAIQVMQQRHYWGVCPPLQCANCALYDNRKSFHWIGVNLSKVELGDRLHDINFKGRIAMYILL